MSTTKLRSDTDLQPKRFVRGLGLHLLLVIISLSLVLPFVWMLLTSVKPLSEVGVGSWLPSHSATVEGGQFSEERFQTFRQQILDSDSELAAYLRQRIDFEAPELTRSSLATQLNTSVIFGETIYAPARFSGVELSPQTQELLDLEARSDKQTSLLNGWLLHDAYTEHVPAPTRLRWYNYLEVFRQIPFARYYLNSIFIAAWVTFLQVFTSSMAAFAFARLEWPGRDKVFVLYLSTMMLPGLVMMIPNYQIMIGLGLVDTLTGLVLPAAFTAFGTFLLRQFMLTVPKSLDEAASIDGASTWRLYWDIILPMARPGLITLSIFTFMGTYHSFFWPLVMLKAQHKYTLPIGLLYFDSTQGQETNLLMAAVTMSIIPMVIVFVCLQKYLVKGIQLGAVKG